MLSWSSGKDSAWTLQVLRQQQALDVVGLLTTVNEQFDRVAMHAVRSELLRAQAEAAELPLLEVKIPWPCSNEQYEAAMTTALAEVKARGVSVMAFGDLFLEDIRAYRVEKLEGTGVRPEFPLWGKPTAELAREMIEGGLQARLTCVDPRVMPRELCGRAFDEALLRELPADVDPCGERGEFHSFVHAGPMFRRPILIRPGEVVERDGFVFADLLPGQA
ncbi:MAG: hypothetical protein K0R38_178 [Polyangiaceae bacterium]|nr:hypothetical protein [Polyangiaceae bacterium]